MRFLSVTLLALLSCTATALLGQTAPTGAKPGVVESVTVKGNQLYSAGDIQQVLGLKVNSPASPELIEQARQRLLATELFDDVSTEYTFTRTAPVRYGLTVTVKESQQLYPVRFERLGNVSVNDLRTYLQAAVPLYADRIPGTEGAIKRYSSAVQQFLQSHGEKDLKVKGAISNEDPKQLAVVFSSSAPAPVISQVFVTGNEAIDTGTILRAVNATAVGVPMTDVRLQNILDGTIKPLYAAKGFAAVTFPKIETEPSKTNQGVIVHLTIKEGPQFKFGSIRFRGQGLEEEEIRSNIPFKPGQVFNSDLVDNFRLDLVRRMRRRGLLDANVTVDSQPDDSKRAVGLVYTVTPGAQYTFQTLNIHGLDVTSEPAVAKLWGEKPGKPFNPEYPDYFLKRIEEQNLFDKLGSTQSDYRADASSHTVTVDLYFKGGDSLKVKQQKAEDEKEKHKSDGTWSPYPY